MGRKPALIILVIADGGKKKGGLCYGSFSVGGFPGEQPFGLPKVALHTADTSTDAEAEILRLAVQWAVCGVEARGLHKKHVHLRIESDSLSLIKKLTRENRLIRPEAPDDYVAERVKQIWKLVEGFGHVEYKWIARDSTYLAFGH